MANIKNHLNNIKNAMFGKDVRNSIHDAIKQCYDDASVNNDNANMEVKLARGVHNTLNDRLSESDKKQKELSSQLEHKASKNDLDVERKRIDSFTKLEEGSTTGDAELIDGRVGADGVVYNNLGNAIRKQIKSNITEFVSLPFILTQNSYIRYIDGEVTSHEDDIYFSSNFIELLNTQYLYIDNLNFPSNNLAGLCFYDDKKSFISGYQYNKDVNIKMQIPVKAKYVRFTYNNSNKIGKLIVYQDSNELLKKITNEINSIENIGYEYETTFEIGYYIVKTSGAKAEYTSDRYSTTDFIELNNMYNNITIKNLNWTSSDLAGGSFYDKNKTFISGVIYDKSVVDMTIPIPQNARYFRGTVRTDLIDSICIYSNSNLHEAINNNSCNIQKNANDIDNLANDIDSIVNDSKNTFNYCQIFHKIGGIGDSLMSGEIAYWSESEQKNVYIDCYNYSWLSNLCKNIGSEAVHYSSGGQTTKSWLSKYLTEMKSEEIKPSAYFIGLGTNDRRSIELGTEDDCGTDNETFYGMYSKIIQEVKAFNSNAVIFCVSLYFNSKDSTVQSYCNAIKYMAEKYGCYYIDFVNNYDYSYDTNANSVFVNVGHFTTTGYVRVAKQMQELTNKVIEENPVQFKFISKDFKDI